MYFGFDAVTREMSTYGLVWRHALLAIFDIRIDRDDLDELCPGEKWQGVMNSAYRLPAAVPPHKYTPTNGADPRAFRYHQHWPARLKCDVGAGCRVDSICLMVVAVPGNH